MKSKYSMKFKQSVIRGLLSLECTLYCKPKLMQLQALQLCDRRNVSCDKGKVRLLPQGHALVLYKRWTV